MYFNRFNQVVQSGLKYHFEITSEWISSLTRAQKKSQYSEIEIEQDQDHNSIDLDETFRNAFLYLLIGLCLSILIYFGELVMCPMF